MAHEINDFGITAFGAYVPRLRMSREAIAAAHEWMAPSLATLAKGERAFCSWDEDAITMGVEAARNALGCVGRDKVASVHLVSNTLPFADLQNASLVALALQLPTAIRTCDLGHSQRAATSGLLGALAEGIDGTLVIASDSPASRAASQQEMTYGAGAAALCLGSGNVLARLVAAESISAGFVDRFRGANQKFDYVWEERWVREEGYAKLVPQAVNSALSKAGLTIGDCHYFVLAAPGKGVSEAVAKKLRFTGKVVPSLIDCIGYAGTAHALLLLVAVLEEAKAGERILLAGFGQGCDVLVFETTAALTSHQGPARSLAAVTADAVHTDAYLRMLSFADQVELEWGMRAEKDGKTALTEQYRSGEQMSGFLAGRCKACSTVQFPQLSYCVNPSCSEPSAQFESESLADVPAHVFTYTADWLNYHPAPPLYVGLIQFVNQARRLMEVVDVGSDGIDIGTPLRRVYRIKELDKARGYRRYFWKATPVGAVKGQ